MNTQLKVLFISNGLFLLACNLIIPVYALFIKNAGGGIELAGLLFGLSFLTSTIVDLLVIRIKDKKYLGTQMLKTNYLVRSLCWLILAIFPSIPVIALMQVVIGVTQSIGGPSFNSLVSENLDQKEHIREWGVWELTANPATAIAGFLSGAVVVYFGFQALFVLMAALGLISFFMLNFYQKRID